MAIWQLTEVEKIKIVDVLTTDLTLATVHLAESLPPITDQLNTAGLTPGEATFTGYAAATLTAPTAVAPDSIRGGYTFMVPTLTFAVGSSPTVFNNIVGGWIQAAATGTPLLVAFQFATPVPMQVALAQLNLTLLMNWLNGAGQFGTSLFVYVNGQIQ